MLNVLKNSFVRKTQVIIGLRFAHIMVFTLLFLLVALPQSEAAHFEKTNKYAAFIMDADTGLILHQENANKRLHPASLTKMMTLLMTFDALDSGTLRLNDRVYISKHAANMVPSKLGLAPGSSIKVEDAIHALVTKSANDIAVALAEKLGQSEDNFALMMTKKARNIGMSRTRFKNASGLHDPAQISTARDMARLGRTLLTTYKKHYHYFSVTKFTYEGKTYRGHNRLMNRYVGMDGLKTGYIYASGFNLVASAMRNDRRLIGVVFGGKTAKSRDNQMEKLLDQGFSKIGAIEIAASYIPVPSKKPLTVIEQKNMHEINTASLPEEPIKTAALDTETETRSNPSEHWSILSKIAENNAFNSTLGEGDSDDNMLRGRVETGLIAIASHLGETIPSPKTTRKDNINYSNGDWSIQVGAYANRESTNRALAQNINRLPAALRIGHGNISPRKTSGGWIYRARIEGYARDTAHAACQKLPDCIVLAPSNP